MAKVICLCGASASGKSMLAEKYVVGNHQRKYIATTTAAIREKFNNPSYDYLMSKEGYSDMVEYQKAIADNLWEQLFQGVQLVVEGDYSITILDRSPMDAYIYEAIYTLNSIGELYYADRPVSPAMYAYLNTIEQYRKRSSLEGTLITFVGLSSLFESNDPKRPSARINTQYKNEVIKAFATAEQGTKKQWLRFDMLPNTRLDIEGRVMLLNRLIYESFKL